MDIPQAFVRVARDVAGGQFEGQIYTFDLSSGVVELVVNPSLAGRIGPEVHERVELARARVLEGSVELEHFGP